MFARVFSYRGLVWRILNTLTDILFLSLMWLFCCLGIITIGAATTALYDSVVHCIRYKEDGVYSRFLRTFRRDFRVSALSTLLWALIIGLCLFLLMSLRSLSQFSSSAVAAAAAWYVVLVLPLGSACWAFPILSRFTFGFRELNITAFRFALAHLPSTAILVLLVGELGRLSVKYLFPLAFTPALLMLLASLFIEPVFKKHGGGLKRGEEAPEDGE